MLQFVQPIKLTDSYFTQILLKGVLDSHNPQLHVRKGSASIFVFAKIFQLLVLAEGLLLDMLRFPPLINMTTMI